MGRRFRNLKVALPTGLLLYALAYAVSFSHIQAIRSEISHPFDPYLKAFTMSGLILFGTIVLVYGVGHWWVTNGDNEASEE